MSDPAAASDDFPAISRQPDRALEPFQALDSRAMTSCANCGHEGTEAFQFCPSCGTPAAASGDGLCGTVLSDKYRILSELGSGTMGTVYLAEHLSLEKKVALKVLHRDLDLGEDALKRFRQEGIAAGKFTHPNAIQIFDFDEADNHVYLAMEYVEGDNLKQFLRKRGKLKPDVAVGLISQVLSALAEAHQVGIVHRDLKPDNIMVVTDVDDSLSIKVLDFGLSKLLHRSVESSLQTQAGRIMGTPLYMAPEQWDGQEIDHRIDLYAAGLILYEMLAGSNPFDAKSFTEILKKTTTEQAPSLIDSNPDLEVSSDLDDILQRALAKHPDDRFQSATAMADALDGVRFGHIARRKTGTRPNLRKSARTEHKASRSGRGGLYALLALVLCVVAPALWFLLSGSRGSSDDADIILRVSQMTADARSDSQNQYLEHLTLARRALRKNEPQVAHTALESAMEMSCKDAEAFYLRAEVYRLQKDDDVARADYAEAVQRDGNFAEAHAGIGRLEYDAGDHEAAKNAFETAYAIDSACPAAIAGLGVMHLAAGETGLARSRLAEAALLAPESAHILCNLGYVQLVAGDFDAAAKAFIAAKRNDKRSWRALAGLGTVYARRERIDDAITQLKAAVELAPTVLEVHVDLAALYTANERHSEALTVVDASLGQHPNSGQLHLLRGLILSAQGDPSGAASALAKSIEHAPDARAHVLLGISAQQQGQLDDAAHHFEAAIALDNENTTAHLDLGLVRWAQGEYGQVEAPLERAIRLSASAPFAHRQLGVLYRDFIGDAQKALEHFETAKRQGDNESRLDAWIAELRRQLGR